MNGSGTRTQCYYMFFLTAQFLEILFKGIDIGTQRDNPVSVESLLNVLHLLSTHVSKAKKNFVVSHIIIVQLNFITCGVTGIN